MPYRIEEKGEKWCVYNSDTGEKKGEHDSRMQAMKQMKALYAAEGKEGGEKKSDAKKKAASGDHDYEDD